MSVVMEVKRGMSAVATTIMTVSGPSEAATGWRSALTPAAAEIPATRASNRIKTVRILTANLPHSFQSVPLPGRSDSLGLLQPMPSQQCEQAQTHHGREGNDAAAAVNRVDLCFQPVLGAEITSEDRQTVVNDPKVVPGFSHLAITQDQCQGVDAGGEPANDEQTDCRQWSEPGAKGRHQFQIPRSHSAKHIKADEDGEPTQASQHAPSKALPSPCDSVVEQTGE